MPTGSISLTATSKPVFRSDSGANGGKAQYRFWHQADLAARSALRPLRGGKRRFADLATLAAPTQSRRSPASEKAQQRDNHSAEGGEGWNAPSLRPQR